MGTAWMLRNLVVIIHLSAYFGLCTILRSCGYIIPEISIIQIGTQFVASCVLNESCIPVYGADANYIYWSTRKNEVPKEQYNVVNRTLAQVTFTDTSVLESPLLCSILEHGQIPRTLYGIFFTLGFPPEKPTNLTCIVYQDVGMTCTWNPGRHTYLPTNFTLKNQWFAEQKPDCIPFDANNSCTIEAEHFSFFVNTELWVEVENGLGKNESDHIFLDPVNIVKPRAPDILNVTAIPELPSGLKVEWENPYREQEMKLKFVIRYRMKYSINFTELPSEDTASNRNFFTLQGLKSFTTYSISIRCMKMDGRGYWSEWSTEVTGTTPETKPSKKVDLWRQLTYNNSGKRNLELMWKKLEVSDANGIILFYEVKISSKATETVITPNTTLRYQLEDKKYTVNVYACNSVGKSPVATLIIPEESAPVLPGVPHFNVTSNNTHLLLEWKAPRFSVNGYIIECVDLLSEKRVIEWQQLESTARSAVIYENIKQFKLYEVSIYPLYNGNPGASHTLKTYLEEGAPLNGPDIVAHKIDKNEVTLVWKLLHPEDQRGFITHYAVVYSPNNGRDSFNVTVDANITECTLSSLTKDTSYLTYLVAFTSKGGTPGRKFTFTTLKYANGEIEAIIVPVCLFFLIFSLTAVLLCFKKINMIKKHVWPNVPDPSNSTVAQWSPQSIMQSCGKEPVCPENTITAVSVVEPDPDDKSKLAEQDGTVLSLEENSGSEDHSSGIGGSSCSSTPRQSVSDSEEGESAQSTSSSVQYSTVVASSYRGQLPSVHVFARSESTQPLLDSEERSEDLHSERSMEGSDNSPQGRHYFRQNCCSHEATVGSLHSAGLNTVSQTVYENSLVGLNHLQMLSHSSGSLEFSPAIKENEELEATPDSLQQNNDGQTVVSLDLLGLQRARESGEPKSYLPQSVKQSGYMPQ
ncbi:interleukin-6 receptor subunit beta-like [Protopterus annectens]|uniref:interleukin-6 receptor subunit beta-like n=1 Tax=Protopterus annectens TaxID=7888 RepID=UPI001CFC1D6E|nr:interleukin-6 receptor subunit beta-like [Protopterus annectens]